jgi:hypothetical protein
MPPRRRQSRVDAAARRIAYALAQIAEGLSNVR